MRMPCTIVFLFKCCTYTRAKPLRARSVANMDAGQAGSGDVLAKEPGAYLTAAWLTNQEVLELAR